MLISTVQANRNTIQGRKRDALLGEALNNNKLNGYEDDDKETEDPVNTIRNEGHSEEYKILSRRDDDDVDLQEIEITSTTDINFKKCQNLTYFHLYPIHTRTNQS